MSHHNKNTVSPRDERLAKIKMNDQGENDMDIQRSSDLDADMARSMDKDTDLQRHSNNPAQMNKVKQQ